MKMKCVLTIAGSDSSGGAGIQADIKTICAHRLYAASVITAVTAQNTLGVQSVYPLPPDVVAAQLDSVCSDIPPDAVKIGMLATAEIAETAARMLEHYNVRHVVLDPVLVSTSGRLLLDKDAVRVLTDRLFPLAELITPNLDEAAVLHDALVRTGCAVLVKGGHNPDSADDVLYESGRLMENSPAGCSGIHTFSGGRIANPNTHGTGCTLASAAACRLAQGHTIMESVLLAKQYITGAIAAGLTVGHGRGPLDQFWEAAGGVP
ncbi:MAG: bifunctional hydroxymethylpyrimidine kinase/phosphomethylpyrimidine kinase [Treponema sp.]|nr:bifunctional hydroxymethylpyrimidine kinase/phosphomethylpyrimidine kinase [Treponema sp.]